MTTLFRFIYVFLNKKWHFDQIVNELIVIKFMNFGYSLSFKTLDKGLIEQLGPTGFSNLIFNTSFNITGTQSGFIYHTSFILISCFCLYFFVYFLITLGFVLSIYNIQFFILIFGFFILAFFRSC
jgi:hypothetical protein